MKPIIEQQLAKGLQPFSPQFFGCLCSVLTLQQACLFVLLLKADNVPAEISKRKCKDNIAAINFIYCECTLFKMPLSRGRRNLGYFNI